MNIGLDMMGGDFAPLEAVKGIAEYLESPLADAHLVMIGAEPEIKDLITQFPVSANKYSIVHASQVIEMHEHPTKALKEKKDSSIAIGFQLLAAGKMDAIALTVAEHQAFTKAWRQAIPYGEGTVNATKEQIANAARQIYKNYPEILRTLGL